MGTFERVRTIVAEKLDVNETLIMAETFLANDLGADSLDKLDIAMEVEEVFDIEFDEDTIEMVTVKEIVDYIEAKRGKL